MKKERILYLANAIIYLISILYNIYYNNYLNRIKDIVNSSSNNYLSIGKSIIIYSPYAAIFLLSLFLLFRKNYNNKWTLWGGIIGLVAVIPQFLLIILDNFLTEEDFPNSNHGYSLEAAFAIGFQYFSYILIIISLLLIVIGIIIKFVNPKSNK